MIARKVGARVKNQNIYNTAQGVYEPAAAVTSDGELIVTFKPRTPAPLTQEVDYIQVKYTPQETQLIRAALGAGQGGA